MSTLLDIVKKLLLNMYLTIKCQHHKNTVTVRAVANCNFGVSVTDKNTLLHTSVLTVRKRRQISHTGKS